MTSPRLVLASSSPRRADILRAAGFSFDVEVPDVDERPFPGESPPATVERVAAIKAYAIGDLDAVVLGVDTVVVLEGEVLGKPFDAADAVATLLRIGGRAHVVLSGWAVLGGERVSSGIERTVVTMHPIDRIEAERYVASGEPLDKAGSYAIQGLGRRFVAEWSGSFSNVAGLPLEAVTDVLERFGVIPAAPR